MTRQPAAFSFPDPERLAALQAEADRINGTSAPPPITGGVLVDADGMVSLPVPDVDAPIAIDAGLTGARRLVRRVRTQLHIGLTLQWAPLPDQGGVLIEFRGGHPDGDESRDAVAVFLTPRGFDRLVDDLKAIAAAARSNAA